MEAQRSADVASGRSHLPLRVDTGLCDVGLCLEVTHGRWRTLDDRSQAVLGGGMGDVGVGGEREDFYCYCQHEHEHVLSVACGLVNTWMDVCGMTFGSNRRLCDCSGGGELRSDKTSKRRIKASPPTRVTARVKEKEKEKERSKRLCSHHCISLTLFSAVFKRENRGVIPVQSKIRLNLPRRTLVARAVLLLCWLLLREPWFLLSGRCRVTFKHPCLQTHLTLRDGAVDGSQDGAAYGLGASCA
jgi:hypothetical protein